jgi:hypothetical protein
LELNQNLSIDVAPFPIASKDQYVLTMICHGKSHVSFYTNEVERTFNIGLKTP